MTRRILKFFDKFEDGVRNKLSRYPITYAFIGAVGVVLFWRGVWGIADSTPFLQDPYVSLLVSIVILLAIGLFVSFFVGDSILLSGLKGEKKMMEKTELEVKKEGATLVDLKKDMQEEKVTLSTIQEELKEVKSLLEEKRPEL